MIGGFDLSLTATGMVAVPGRWRAPDGSHDWSRIRVDKAGHGLRKDASEPDRLNRVRTIRQAVLDFASLHGITVALVEQYAFSAMASQAHALGELGGVVKLALLERGIEVVVVSPASARKCLGKQPRAQAKLWAAQRLYAVGAPKTWTGDQLDAFVLVNHHLAENGGDAIILPAVAA